MYRSIFFLFVLLNISCKNEGNKAADPMEEQVAEQFSSGNSQDSVYLFTSFREPADKGLFLTYSTDGYKWQNLGGPYLKPEVGESKIMRDPSVAKSDDDTYHMVWTTDWRGGNGFGYASTKDFIHWSEEQFIPAMAQEPDVVNVWAPEIFFDKARNRFIILWASTIPFRFEKGIEDENNNHRMYYTTTQDFEEFTPTELFMDAGFSMIDCVIVKRAEEDYVLVIKDNTRPNRNLKVAFGDAPLGPYENISQPFTGELTEGPTVINQDGKFLIFYDNYGKKTFSAVATEDFKKFENIDDKIEFPEGHKHGTITKISKQMLEALQVKSRELL